MAAKSVMFTQSLAKVMGCHYAVKWSSELG